MEVEKERGGEGEEDRQKERGGERKKKGIELKLKEKGFIIEGCSERKWRLRQGKKEDDTREGGNGHRCQSQGMDDIIYPSFDKGDGPLSLRAKEGNEQLRTSVLF